MNQVKYWLEKLLDKANLSADLEKAVKAYQVGDRTTALAELTPLAEAGGVQAQFILGLISYDDGEAQDYAEALKWFSLAKEKGYYLPAYYFLAEMYHYGKGVEQDDEKAREFYYHAADGGVAEARYEMGMILLRGGDPRDVWDMAEWFKLAAEEGIAEAQYEMGVCRERGRGVTRITDLAYAWYHLAAIQGHKKAKESRDRIAKHMPPERIAVVKKKAEEMKKEHEKKMAEIYK